MEHRNFQLLLLALTTLGYGSATLADHPTVAFGSEDTGAINTFAATKIPVGSWSVGFRTEIIDNDEFSENQLEAFAENDLEGVHSIDEITNTSLSLTYGLTEKLSLTARLPYIERKNIRESEIEDGEPEAHTHGDSSGFGDISLLAQYLLTSKDTNNTALIVGIKAPTGKTDEKDDDNVRFETEFQAGSGSWDFLLGASHSGKINKVGYHANVLYNATTEGSQSTEIGDSITYNLAFTYAFADEHDEHQHSHESRFSDLSWSFAFELNGETRREDEISGEKEEHSGGTTIYAAPGIRLSGEGFGAFLSYGVPIIENQKGIQTDVGSRLVAGFSLNF